jgi:putative DNA primase/helicase
MMAADNGLTCRETALLALEYGLSPVPPREDGTKAPLPDLRGDDGEPTWMPYQTTPASREHVEKWYRGRGRGVGLALGPGGSECFDFDSGDTYREYIDLAHQVGLGELLERVRAGYEETSPGGGIHWLYRCEVVEGSTKLAERPDAENPSKRKTLIETKGQGGFIIIAPTNGKVHPSGGAYKLVRGGLATTATITPEERVALFALARTFDEMTEQPKRDPDPYPPERAAKKSGKFPEIDKSVGDDYAERMSWEDILDPAGWAKVYSRGDVIYWRRPDKKKGISATTGHCKGLKVFTTSTAFDTKGTYTKLGAYAAINHRGDFTAAVKELAEAGYGTWIDNDGEIRPNPVPKGWKRQAKAASRRLQGPIQSPSANGDALNERLASVPRTDVGNGERLVARFGADLRYCHPWKKWLRFDGQRWKADDTAIVRQCAKQTARQILNEAATCADHDECKARTKWWCESEDKKRIEAMLSCASNEPGVPILPNEMDRDGFLLNVQNGTIDVRKGALRPHRREDLITRMAPVDYVPDAKCPTWLRVLGEIFKNDRELIGFWQQLCGICLTADVSNHILPVL